MRKPLPKAKAYRFNRRNFLHYRKQGWNLFSGVNFRPCERRLVVDALKVVMRTSIGMNRKIDATSESVRRILPFVAREVAEEVKDKISPNDAQTFSALMERLANSLTIESADGYQPKSLIELKKSITEQGQRAINSAIGRLHQTFEIDNEERPVHRNDPYDFRKNLEFQIKHDINYAISEIYLLMARNN